MKQLVRRLPLLLVLGTLTAGPALAQTPRMSAPQTSSPQTPAPAPPQNLSPPPAPARPQPITVQAGTGVLLPLPQPASTVMSADPGSRGCSRPRRPACS